MFETLSDRALAVVEAARREAARRGDPLVLRAHLLVGLLEEGSPDGAGVLLARGLTADEIRASASGLFSHANASPRSIAGLSVPAVDAIGLAREYADSTGHERVEPGHLLAAVVEVASFDEMVVGETLLAGLGIDAESLRQEVFQRFHEGQSPERRSAARAGELFLAHPGAQGLEQVVAGIVRLHDELLSRGDYQGAVVLRGTLRELARDQKEPLEEWVMHAERLLNEMLDVYGGGNEEK